MGTQDVCGYCMQHAYIPSQGTIIILAAMDDDTKDMVDKSKILLGAILYVSPLIHWCHPPNYTNYPFPL